MVASVLVDDSKDLYIFYSGSQWTHEVNADGLYNRTLSVCRTDTHTSPAPSFSFSFFGSDINVYAPRNLKSGIAFNYTIDGTNIRPGIINTDSDINGSVNIWNLQGLDTTVYHSLKIFPSAGQFSIDYLTYTPTQNSPLVGLDLILDDADESIHYSSNWTKSGNAPVGLPYKGTTTGTSAKGSTMSLTFTGSSISVYGLLNQKDGKLSASFSVDGGAPTIYTPFNGTQTTNASTWTSQQFFHQDLVPGSHSLHAELEEVTGSQMLWIDSVIFEASANTPTSTTSNSTRSKFSLGGTVGGVAGGLLVLVTIIAAFKKRPPVRPVAPDIIMTRHTTETVQFRY